MRISRHPISASEKDIRGDLQTIYDRLPRLIAKLKANPVDVNHGAACGLQFRALSSAVHLQRPESEIYEHFYYTLQFGLNQFKLALHPDESIQLTIGESSITATGFKTREHVYFSDWSTAFYTASVLRNKEALIFLNDVTEEFMETSTGARHNPLDISVIALMKAMGGKKDLTGPIYVFRETEQADEDRSTTRENFDKHLTIPMVNVMEAMHANDSAAFNARLREALISHHEFYKPREEDEHYGRPLDPFGWLAYKLLAVCAHAHDRGIKIDVESDYIPGWLVRGDFKNCRLTVI